jgi:hypothetical protein
MSRKQKIPTWILSDEFGIDRDKYNWILYIRGGSNTTNWKAKYYYPTPQKLLADLYQQVALTIPPHYDFVHHLEVATDRAHSLFSEFLARIHSDASLEAIAASDSSKHKPKD